MVEAATTHDARAFPCKIRDSFMKFVTEICLFVLVSFSGNPGATSGSFWHHFGLCFWSFATRRATVFCCSAGLLPHDLCTKAYLGWMKAAAANHVPVGTLFVLFKPLQPARPWFLSVSHVAKLNKNCY